MDVSRQPLLSQAGWARFMVCLFVAAICVPALNLAVDPSSNAHIPDYLIPLLGKYLCFALLAVSLDLVWGYAGILSLGHGAFFALGGYAVGMHMMRAIGDRGVYGNPDLPDFMVFLNWQELPWYWWGFDQFGFAAIMAIIVPGLLAFIFGWLAFRSRITGVYFSIISQAMVFALMLAFFRNDFGFGGNNGLTDFKDILGFELSDTRTRMALYMLSVLALAGGYLLCRFIVTSKLGRVMLALKDAEPRVRFLGYRPANAKVVAFTASAMLAGIAGALYVPQVGIINPSEFSPANSIEIAIWVAIGGRGSLYGAIFGAVLVNLAKSYLTGVAAETWLFFLGALFIFVTLFLPAGLVGLAKETRRIGNWLDPKRRQTEAAAAAEAEGQRNG
jgi:urea transport system permease protein